MPSGLVCLTFDFDALSACVARGVVSPTPLSRGEFAAVAAPRLLRLLTRRGLVATWFVPRTPRAPTPTCAARSSRRHEVALHGYAHENVAVLERDVEADLLARRAPRSAGDRRHPPISRPADCPTPASS